MLREKDKGGGKSVQAIERETLKDRLMEEEDEMTKQKKIGKQTSNMIDTERSKVTKFRYKTVVKVSFDL